MDFRCGPLTDGITAAMAQTQAGFQVCLADIMVVMVAFTMLDTPANGGVPRPTQTAHGCAGFGTVRIMSMATTYPCDKVCLFVAFGMPSERSD